MGDREDPGCVEPLVPRWIAVCRLVFGESVMVVSVGDKYRDVVVAAGVEIPDGTVSEEVEQLSGTVR